MGRTIPTPSILLIALLVVAGTSAIALALGGTHGRGDPSRPASVGNWPAELTRIANRVDRVGGSWVNSSDTFLYDGDARACNDFLRDYAQVPQPRLNIIIEAPRRTTDGAIAGPAHDWELQVLSWGNDPQANVTIYLGGRIALADLVVPVTIGVDAVAPLMVAVDASASAVPPDLEAFVAAHRTKRSAVTALPPARRPATVPATRPSPR